MDKCIKKQKNELKISSESSLNEKDNNVDIGEDNNKKVVNEDNNYDSQTHDNGNEITR